MANKITAEDVKTALSDGDEIAVFDVREHGQYGEGHLFFAVPLPYSRFESGLPNLAPSKSTRIVLCDDGDGISDKAAARAEAIGYTNVHVLDGGAPAWAEAGYTLYKGVNVPSKTFGELLEEVRHTPRLTATEVNEIQKSGSNHIILDGRTPGEFARFAIPGGISCPNGELALRVGAIVPDKETTIIVNCAGRTRSILGAQTLIDFGVENPVYALENGTQGWFLAGLDLENGADRRADDTKPDDPSERAAHARKLAESAGVTFVDTATVSDWLADNSRTTYLLDVRRAEEFEADGIPGSSHSPGGQLVQATDHWIGVRNAHVVLLDSDGVRAPMAARWLCHMGHQASVLEGGVMAAKSLDHPARSTTNVEELPTVKADDLDDAETLLLDLRASQAYRDGHLKGALWSIRPRVNAINVSGRNVVIAADAETAALAAKDLREAGATAVSRLDGGPDEWRAAGLAVVSSPDTPPDAERIDHLFFTAERHNGNEAASRQYLEWEIGLVGQLDEQERGVFRFPG